MRLTVTRAAAAVAALGLLLLAPAAATATPSSSGSNGANPAAVADEPPVPTDGPCAYLPTPDDPPARPVTLPNDPDPTSARGMVRVTLETNRGDIPLVLNKRWAPCTVQSFLHLVRSGFYDQTICHRLTTYDTLKVLQCGDPLGTGYGGPGYSYRDELPTMLLPWPGDVTNTRRNYFRGSLAMANAGPDTNGSQFFLTYRESRLRPDYTVFGYIEPSGLAVLDRIAAGGVKASEEGAPLDGLPARGVRIEDATRG